jgi:protease II
MAESMRPGQARADQAGPGGGPPAARVQPVTETRFGIATTDPYRWLRVGDGVRYPAVLLVAGRNDPRLAVWQPAKMAARLQTATASGRPVLFRVDPDAGHGLGSTQAQRDGLTADILAFLLHELA